MELSTQPLEANEQKTEAKEEKRFTTLAMDSKMNKTQTSQDTHLPI